MTDAWRPTPGRDARTRDGRKVTELREVWAGNIQGVFFDDRTLLSTWRKDGKSVHLHLPSFDLVADWEPQPATTAQPSAVRQRTVTEIVPGTYGRVALGGHLDGKAQVSFTDKNMKRLDQWDWLTPAELRAAATILTQVADAMEVVE